MAPDRVNNGTPQAKARATDALCPLSILGTIRASLPATLRKNLMPSCPPMPLRLCGALALSALVLSACAPAASRPSIAEARGAAGADAYAGTEAHAETVADTDGLAGYPTDMNAMQFAAPQAANVRKLGDGELSCEEIYAETQVLDRTAREQQAKAREAQDAMAKSQEAMISQATSRSSGVGMGVIGGSLLSMVPGGGLVSGLAMKAATNSRASAMQEETNRLMRTQTEMMNSEQALQYTRARSDHLAGLFLDKGCRLSDVQRVPSAAQ